MKKVPVSFVLFGLIILLGSGVAVSCEVGGCRMTGGNVTVNGEYADGTYAESFYRVKSDRGMDDVWYTVGGQIGAPEAGCCSGPDCAYGEWTHTQHAGFEGSFTFHAGTNSAPDGAYISCITCTDPGWCAQARCAPWKQIYWDGYGVFKNDKNFAAVFPSCNITPGSSLHYFKAHVGDFGEPGRQGKQQLSGNCTWRSDELFDPYSENWIGAVPSNKFGDRGGQACEPCPDYYEIEIHCGANPVSDVIYRGSGFITGGNLQIHPEVGQHCPY